MSDDDRPRATLPSDSGWPNLRRAFGLDTELRIAEVERRRQEWQAQQEHRKDVANAVEQSAEKATVSHGNPSDRTLATYLDYAGLGAILFAIEEMGRRWFEEQPITQHHWVAFGAFMVAGGVSLGLARRIKNMPVRAGQPLRGRLSASFDTVAHNAVTWLVTAALIIFGIPLTFWAISSRLPAPPQVHLQTNTQVLCWDGPCPAVHLKPGPDYLKEIGLGVGGPEPLLLTATPALTGDRLRIFVDYSEYRSGWMPKTRVFIGEFKEPVKDKTERLQLIYYLANKPNAGTNNLWWGNPSQNHPVTASTFDGAPLPAIIVRARLVIVGANGEQHHYFILVRGADNTGTYVGVIPQHNSGDWIESWEAN